jgi:2-polyprenyl-3-methyl-5-hydroxy-6-metoxy-1,4-benzoquinol methylase
MTVRSFDDPLSRRYLQGAEFDENITFSYDFQTPLQDRMALLLQLAAGKRILHIGCCDHIPLLPEKLASGAWLHGRLTEIAADCVGIDNDSEAVRLAGSLTGLDNIFYGDVTAEQTIAAIGAKKFDYALFGEVLEHIGNPVHFLASFLARYRPNIENVIITVPNAFRGGNIRNIFKTRETINSDHRFFFTPYTLPKVAWDAGLSPVAIQMAHYSAAGPVKRAILNRFPLLAEDIVYIGAPR